MKFIKLLSVAGAALLWAGASAVKAAPADLIVDGSFETPNVGMGAVGFTSIPGWTVNQDLIELDFTPILGLPFYNGCCQSLEVDADTFDTVSQTVTGLHPGSKYTLSWGYGDRPGSGPQQLNVFFGGSLVTTDFGSGSGIWTPNSFVVTATAASEVLSFAAVDTSGIGGNPSVGNELDDVSLTAVPEPASMLLVCSGLLGVGLLRRKRG